MKREISQHTSLKHFRILPHYNAYNRYRDEMLTLILKTLKVTRQTASASFGSFCYVKKGFRGYKRRKQNIS